MRNIAAVFLAPFRIGNKPRLRLLTVALSAFLAHTVMGDIANHSFEQPGATWSGAVAGALQRPDGNIWMIYEQPEDGHNIIDGFEGRRFFKTTVVLGSGERFLGSD